MSPYQLFVIAVLTTRITGWLVFTGERPYHRSFSIKTTVEELHGRSLMNKISLMVDFLDVAVSKYEGMSTDNSTVELIPIKYNPDDPEWSLGQSIAFVKGPLNELRGNCHRLGGKLVQPASKSQFDFIKEALKAEGEEFFLLDGWVTTTPLICIRVLVPL